MKTTEQVNIMIQRLSAIFFLTTFVSPILAGDGAPSETSDLAAKCDAYMQARVRISKFSGTVLVARDGKPVYMRGFGFANREYDIPNSPETKFRLASVSKQFTAAGIMILENEGKLKVDDPVSKHVPYVPDSWGAVTLAQLMSHTGGIPENLRPALFKGMWPQPIAVEQLLDHIKKQPLDFKPGEKWSYSNTGYALLGMVIEKVSGQSYGDFLKERIFKPLGMNDTGIDSRKLVLKNRATGYGMSGTDFINAQHIDMSQVYAAGSMYSTVLDLLKWDNALYTNKILPQKSWERMWSPVKDGYGYGWLSLKRFGKKFISHDGGLPGFVTTVWRFPEDKVFVTALCNLEGSAHQRAARDLSAIILGQSYDVPVLWKETKVDPKSFDALVGEYQLDKNTKISITRGKEEIYAQLTGQGRFRIRPESTSKFFAQTEEVTIEFGRNWINLVDRLTLHQNGKDAVSKRLK